MIHMIQELFGQTLKKLHPQIFPPAFISAATSSTGRNHLFISFAREDRALAVWLTQKLTAEGYKVWCEALSLLGGENYPKDVDAAITTGSFRFIALYSEAALQNAELSRQRSLALAVADPSDFVIPLSIGRLATNRLDRKSTQLTFVEFDNWALGLRQLLKKLETISCPRPLGTGRSIAAQSFLQNDFLSNEPELLLSNHLRFEKIPERILHFFTETRVNWREVPSSWGYKYVAPGNFYSFQAPPPEAMRKLNLEKIDEYAWGQDTSINGISSLDLVSELLRKALYAKCRERGLLFCRDTHVTYFPSGLVAKDRIRYARPDGMRSHISVVGKRKYWRPGSSSEYRYYLVPDFFIKRDIFGRFSAALRVRVRITDPRGTVLPPRTSLSRRKHLCKDWWNDDWLHRTLAIAQFIGDDGRIVIGSDEIEQIVIPSDLVPATAPRGIEEDLLGSAAYEERADYLRDRGEEPDGPGAE
jgi:hypothetical protein